MGKTSHSLADQLSPLHHPSASLYSHPISCESIRKSIHPTNHHYSLCSTAAAAASLSALLALFSSNDLFFNSRISRCLCSAPCNQYPKLAPVPAKIGHIHNDSLLKNGRISRPSCQNRVAMPAVISSVSFLRLKGNKSDQKVDFEVGEYIPKPVQNKTLPTILRGLEVGI